MCFTSGVAEIYDPSNDEFKEITQAVCFGKPRLKCGLEPPYRQGQVVFLLRKNLHLTLDDTGVPIETANHRGQSEDGLQGQKHPTQNTAQQKDNGWMNQRNTKMSAEICFPAQYGLAYWMINSCF
jgi:hypothetical protein